MSKRVGLRLLILVILALVPCSAGARQQVPPVDGNTQAGMTSSACASARNLEAQLVELYTHARTMFSGDELALAALTQSQEAWVRFKDAQVHFLYHDADKPGACGSALSMCSCQSQSQLLSARMEELRTILQDRHEDVCNVHRPVGGEIR
jgi:uncharacterized protein YecT (DUF1311 family)